MKKTFREKHGWKIGPVQESLETPLFRAIAAEVINPRNGADMLYRRFEFTPWVNIIALTPQQEIILVRQFRFGTETMEWELPGGVVEQDEDPLPAAIRELKEETGFIGKNARIIGRTAPNPAIQNNELCTILVEDAVKSCQIKLDPMEDITCHLAPLDEVFTMIKSGDLRHAFTHVGLMHWLLQSGQLG